jgi:hypothetical protein
MSMQKLTPEWRAAISAGMKRDWASGRPITGMSGKKHSPETIERMRASAKARVTDELRERWKLIRNQKGWPKGRPHTAETKAKISATKLRRSTFYV